MAGVAIYVPFEKVDDGICMKRNNVNLDDFVKIVGVFGNSVGFGTTAVNYVANSNINTLKEWIDTANKIGFQINFSVLNILNYLRVNRFGHESRDPHSFEKAQLLFKYMKSLKEKNTDYKPDTLNYFPDFNTFSYEEDKVDLALEVMDTFFSNRDSRWTFVPIVKAQDERSAKMAERMNVYLDQKRSPFKIKTAPVEPVVPVETEKTKLKTFKPKVKGDKNTLNRENRYKVLAE